MKSFRRVLSMAVLTLWLLAAAAVPAAASSGAASSGAALSAQAASMAPAAEAVLLSASAQAASSSAAAASSAQTPSQQTVRVGFFSADGYHCMSDDGIMSGYGYDLLQMLLRYDDWSYEYVGYDLNWGDMLDMLENDEIDLVTLANKTPEREAKFDYSAEPVGTSSTVMTIAADNTQIVPGDYATYSGAAVGLVKGSSHNEKFEAYAAEKGFAYRAVYYDDVAELLADLRAHSGVDIAVTSNMRVAYDEIILDEFDQTDYYAIVKKGNTRLLRALDYAIGQLDVYSPDWRVLLFRKYYADINSEAISLSPSEREYIAGLAASGTVIRAAMNPELKPYSYFEDGKACGIVPQLFDSIASRLGIAYEILPSADRMEYKRQLQSGQADVDLTAFQDFGIAQKYNLKETDAFLTSCLTMLSRSGAALDPDTMTVAAVADPTEFASFNSELLYKSKCIEFASLSECAQAVKDGRCDAAYFYAYSAEQILSADYAKKLQGTILPEYGFGLTIGVQNDSDHRLLAVLNKGVGSLTDSYVKSVCLGEISKNDQTVPLLGVIYSHPILTLVVSVVFVALLAIAAQLAYADRNRRRTVLANAKLNRFIGYICENYDLVTEINLKDRVRTDYRMRGGRLVETSYPYVPLVRADYEKIAHPEDIDKILATSDETRIGKMIDAGGGPDHFEVQIKDAAGQYRWYDYTIRAIARDAGHPRNYIMFKRDIQASKDEAARQQQTLRDALESAQSASAAKGSFLSRMSHEIRTPLNAVIGYMELAKDPANSPEKIMHCVENTDTAARHLLSIINDVLDISAIESGRMKVAHEDFNLKELITDIASLFYNQAKGRGITFEVLLSGITQEWVVGDRLRVNQILMNLLSNAMKFTPENGRIIFRVDQLRREDGKVFLRFVVSDNGIGMSEKFRQRLFKPFEQESAVTAQKYGGTGLGLSITSNLVEMLGGSIAVDSTPGAGTAFTVTLHFDLSSHPEQAEDPIDYAHVRVLVVDDEPDEGTYIKATLKRCGVKSDCVTSGALALKRLRSRAGTEYAYNLCILDWKMPDMDGMDVAEKIRAEFGAEMPIIIATAYDALSLMNDAKKAGIDRVVSKPLFQSTLHDLLVSTFGTVKLKAAAAQPEKRDLRGMHILIAEDNAMNMEIAVTVLEKAGAVVDQAVDGRQAADKFLQAPAGTYSLILMDVQMPVLNGYEATRAIRHSQHPEAAAIPIIAMTANAFAEDVAEALSNGMNAHIAKPVNYEKLYRVMHKYGEGRMQQQQKETENQGPAAPGPTADKE